ncbi:MAG: hypothetical protein HW376_1615 [candidate division NC10 bacterium]|nr:hypothetical protein [candidate division NC10 bacterium]
MEKFHPRVNEYKYIFAADLPRYRADGWELCGPMKHERYTIRRGPSRHRDRQEKG